MQRIMTEDFLYVTTIDDIDYDYLDHWLWKPMKASNNVYIYRRDSKRGKVYMHREIAQRMGQDLSGQTDHIDRDSLNNVRANLRPATFQQNIWNSPVAITNSSGYRGVSWCSERGKWQVHIKYNSQNMSLGRFDDKIQAALAYDRAALRYFGEFASLNFP